MKKIILASLLLTCFAISDAFSQSATRSIHVSGYNSVTVSSTIDIVFDKRFEDSIYVESSADLIDKLGIEIKGTSVTIGYKKASKGALKSNRKSVVYMSASHLANLNANGDNAIAVNQKIEGKAIQIKLADQSVMKADIATNSASLKLSGNAKFEGSLNSSNASFSLAGNSSVMIASGKCSKMSLSTSGESEFNGRRLTVSNFTKCSLGASSKADLVMNGDASITTSGSSSLFGEMNCKKASISMSKTCRVAVSGSCKALVLKTSGNCDFKNTDFIADNSAACTVSGSSTVDIKCRGNVSVKASDACNVNVLCDGILKIAASGTSNVTYLEGTKVTSLSIKDQATSRALKQTPVVYNPIGTATTIIH